jgi:hypothetical protein
MRLPLVASTGAHDDAAWGAALAPPSPSPRRRWGWPAANPAAFAAIGALLLAVGVGVLIGRSGRGTASAAGPQRVTVVLSGADAPVGAPAPAAASPAEGTTGASAAAASTKKAASRTPVATKAVPKPVSVGSSGKGPGFQKGKFTGNFFGGG